MQINGRDLITLTAHQFKKGLASKRNMLVLGQSGLGKTAIVYEYAEANDLKVIDYDLAGRLPEEVAGIPYVETTAEYRTEKIETLTKEFKELNNKLNKLSLEYGKEDEMLKVVSQMSKLNTAIEKLKNETGNGSYKRMLDEDLNKFFEAKGEGYILLFDEVNQGSPDTLNTLYRITHPNPAMRKWAGHDISKCQIVALGNLSDGTDGTVYLTDLPTPLLNRFFVFQLIGNDKETTDYLRNKYKNIPLVSKYIKEMLKSKVSPRDIDLALDILQYDCDGMFLEAKLGASLTAKLYDIQKGIKSVDPVELLTNSRKIYEEFKASGEVMFGAETITTEDALIEKFSEILSDEEIASIIKGGKK